MNAVAWDEFRNFQKSLEIVVANIPCAMPLVDVADAVPHPDDARQIYKMIAFSEEGSSTIDCEYEVDVS